MSLAQLKYENLIETQNILITPDISGNSNKIFFNNQDVSGFPGLATDSFIMECLSPSDPQFPDNFLVSYQAGSPSPNVPIIAMAGNGGSNNNPVVSIAGDLAVGGDFVSAGTVIFPDLSAGACIVDNSGNLNTVQTFQGTIKDAISDSENLGSITDNSWYVIDQVNKMATIYINVSGKLTADISGINTPLFYINPSAGSQTPAVPLINTEYLNNNPNVNLITFCGNINNTTYGVGVSGVMYMEQVAVLTNQVLVINFAPNWVISNGDDVLVLATVSYPIN